VTISKVPSTLSLVTPGLEYAGDLRAKAVQQRCDRERKQATTAQLEMDRYLRDDLFVPLDGNQYNPASWWRETEIFLFATYISLVHLSRFTIKSTRLLQ
jgi:hypothetical protein